jgi:redox-sensitive bicupin YhaK (pirin superfamily)
MADEIVVETVPLKGSPWPTVDPFLFCVHHDDAYPAGNGHFGPDAPLAGRELGADFAGIDGWRMYHGLEVPGFPQHPHRGFETVTFVRRGFIDHSDSLGATARFGRGDVQWLTAGKGVVHSEMFPLLDGEAPNPLELFQIWLNLPAANKMVDPYFTMLWAEDLPHLRTADEDGREVDVTVIAGPLGDLRPPAPPPDSWAARDDSDLAIWHVVLAPHATWALPAATGGAATTRTVYVFDGAVRVDDHEIGTNTAALLQAGVSPALTAGDQGVEALVLQGRPIGEPVAQYGPFVMHDRPGIERAFADYRATGFGGWPFPTDDPVHGRDAQRFARHPDGRTEHPNAALTS